MHQTTKMERNLCKSWHFSATLEAITVELVRPWHVTEARSLALFRITADYPLMSFPLNAGEMLAIETNKC